MTLQWGVLHINISRSGSIFNHINHGKDVSVFALVWQYIYMHVGYPGPNTMPAAKGNLAAVALTICARAHACKPSGLHVVMLQLLQAAAVFRLPRLAQYRREVLVLVLHTDVVVRSEAGPGAQT